MANIFRVDRTNNKIELGTTDTTINIDSHTASKTLALDASKNLESIQDLRTSASPTFAGLTLTGNITMPDDGWIGRSSSHCIVFDDTLTEVRFQSQLVSAYFDGSWNVFELQNFYTGAGNGGSYNLYRARGTQASPSAVLDSDVLGRIEVRGYDGDTWEDAAAIKFYVNDTVSDGVVPCKIAFFTTDSGGSWGQRASILNDGKFGIGVDAKTLLTVEGTITLKEQAAADGDTAAYGQIWVKTVIPNELWFTDDIGIDHLLSDVKSKRTYIGGFAIKLTNTTGANTIAGQVVMADPGTNDAVVICDGATTADSGDIPIGVFLDSGVADDAEAWVVVSGIADVAIEDNVAAVRSYWVGASADEDGYADIVDHPKNAPDHFHEIGHCIENVAAGGGGTHILARCVLHFN